MWIGYSRGVRRIKADGQTEDYGPAQGLTLPWVTTLQSDRAGNLSIGTYNGLYRLSQGKLEMANYPDQFAGSTIQQVFEDREGGLWVAAATGLFRLEDSIGTALGRAEGLRQTSVYSVRERDNGTWWFGLWPGGVYAYDQNQATPLVLPSSIDLTHVSALWEQAGDTLWIGANSGLYRYRKGAITNFYRKDLEREWKQQVSQQPGTVLPGIAESSVNSLASDMAGGLWVATDGGLYRGGEAGFRAYSVKDGLPGNTCVAVLRAKNGDVWVSVLPAGVACLRSGHWTSYACGQGLPRVAPRGLYEDFGGAIWVTTQGGGLSRFKNGHWRTFSVQDGLADNSVSGIIEDQAGNFWVAFPRGVMRLGRTEFDEVASGQRAKLQPRVFDQSDGLPAAECNPLGAPNMWRSRDGRLLFATDRGVGVVYPDRVRTNGLAPPVHIERLLVNGKEADLCAPLVVPPGHNDVEIRYTGISLLAPERVKFMFRLEPLDREWVDTGSRRDVHYAKLPPGNYTFRVIACNNDGIWNKAGAAVDFSVKPYFYQTAWFKLLLLVLIGGTAYGVHRGRGRLARRRMAALERLVDQRTRELQAAKDRAEAAVVAKEAAQQKLLASSRQAGMAEVATSVLHNVGNVLTSVNVSADMLSSEIERSKASYVGRLAALLMRESKDLQRFVSRDPRGQQLAPFLTELAQDLTAEQSAMLEEIDSLKRNVGHIKDIIAAQQNYAKVSGLAESVNVSELVEDALRISQGALTHHDIAVTKEYAASLPPATVEKQKVLQILVNLLQNAKYACEESRKHDKELNIRLASRDGRMRVEVADNGVGISPENLTRVFGHGFTTRKEGHGFGLHNSALAARELGGTLTAESEGPGKGARFILDFPCQPETKNL